MYSITRVYCEKVEIRQYERRPVHRANRTSNTRILAIPLALDRRVFTEQLSVVKVQSVVPRGSIDIKGKGPMNTYWLETM